MVFNRTCKNIFIYIFLKRLLLFSQALDYLAIGVHELANMSERRIERLVNPGKEFQSIVERGINECL